MKAYSRRHLAKTGGLTILLNACYARATGLVSIEHDYREF